MTRSNTDRITEIEAEQALMNEKLDAHERKLDAQAIQLSEITASLATLARAMTLLEEESASVGDAASAHTVDRGLRSITTTLLPSFDGEDPIEWVARAEQ
ncbi:unnamed protein product [Cuscuta epithymum]|uniref:Uncharacterized protein n=1 Tax=Cuscuta epithymum TaxID=186058 RepID=A0AAV0GGQ9_9ASTE|nr:unnamed protein product [Cuscuta epithymum]